MLLSKYFNAFSKHKQASNKERRYEFSKHASLEETSFGQRETFASDRIQEMMVL